MTATNPLKTIIFLAVIVVLVGLVFAAIQYQDVILRNVLWLAVGAVFIFLIVKISRILRRRSG